MPTKQQNKLFIALAEKQVKLFDEEEKIWWLEHPWYENPYYPKPWNFMEGVTTPELTKEKNRIKLLDRKITEELLKLYDEMYPKDQYPEMHKSDNEQQSIFDAPRKDAETKALVPVEPEAPVEEGVVMDADEVPLEGEELVKAAEEIFGVKATQMSPQDQRYAKIAEEKNALVYTVNNGHVNVLLEKKRKIPENLSDSGKSILAKFNSL